MRLPECDGRLSSAAAHLAVFFFARSGDCVRDSTRSRRQFSVHNRRREGRRARASNAQTWAARSLRRRRNRRSRRSTRRRSPDAMSPRPRPRPRPRAATRDPRTAKI
eukprot:31017-Pelagococcus_subviridis.AAC.11